ncbi:MAG: hypothetical protein GW941_01445 [Candidatus Pacebacteria bacterium]|nr:hypothetical protein [Candidatus Paceibacterota bacterium]
MQKAKSRLTNRVEITSVQPIQPVQKFVEPSKNRNKKKESVYFLKNYLSHLPALFMAGLFYIILLMVMVNINPDLIKDFILPSTYLPVLALIFLANFFLLSFIFLNSKRGLFYTTLLTIITFLKFQKVIFEPTILLILVLTIIFFEIFFNIIQKLFKHQD